MDHQCICGSRNMSTIWTKHSFAYGVDGGSQVTLIAMVPVRWCRDCNEAFLDYVAEEIMSQVVTEHLRKSGHMKIVT